MICNLGIFKRNRKSFGSKFCVHGDAASDDPRASRRNSRCPSVVSGCAVGASNRWPHCRLDLPLFMSSSSGILQISQTFKRNAGHSKWANIKHIKAAKDAQRSLIFTRLSRQMKVAIQEAGGITNPDMNLKLSQIIDQAKRANMPTATIQNVIKSVQSKKEDCKSGFIELKGPNGLIILCEIFTNNFNRSKANIAIILKKFNAKFADGKSRNIFQQKGIIETKIPAISKEENILEIATEHAIESGAEDVKQISDDALQFICEARTLKSVQISLEKANYVITSASIEYVPTVCVNFDDDEELERLSVLFDRLENCEDVVKVYDNIG